MEEKNEIITFDFKEIVAAMVREKGLKEGIWALYVEFGIAAANMAFGDEEKEIKELPDKPPTNILPTAIIPIKKIGIVRTRHLSDVSVDASKINSSPKKSKSARK